MANFIVTFRFKSDSSYQERYDGFVKKVQEIATTYPWPETSSFFAFEANETADSLASRLWLETGFDTSKDIMLVVDVKNRSKTTKGKIEYPTLLDQGLGF
ncbi:hypothetical protein C1Y35_19835 [Pseudomonas sp. GW456-L14]|uniref:hypothetical protein n=1 Tax=unclassified Pseudomonas TaxID=196821 RepID=UPI000C880FEA|nr:MULTISPECIES: hypothetical protein [unclassified Pseudomonas]PMY37401.1 hypothetical protein C1Y35_19835 [Pseudomonas sp. GW456-L14]PMY59414.1 hypothetical protein C1Y34_02135 [Pseudomonas sp. GW456-L12]